MDSAGCKTHGVLDRLMDSPLGEGRVGEWYRLCLRTISTIVKMSRRILMEVSKHIGSPASPGWTLINLHAGLTVRRLAGVACAQPQRAWLKLPKRWFASFFSVNLIPILDYAYIIDARVSRSTKVERSAA
jgi:hypothetical protein